ncbi:MAG: dihydroorotate dehydrogenase electron transfer subunit [Proteobacteria bacterium]|nr:dihydroorotate dehydrogenase electron transfer subunit [Pseudomonadota bacterium]
MRENISKIALNETIGGAAVRIRFPVDWPSFDPGQFVMVEVPGREVFLRRPFGIVRLADGLAEICVKVVGRGTDALSMAAVGTPIRATGPCGRGFALPEKGRTSVLVAGGYGIGPLFGLCERLMAQGREAVLYYGAGTSSDLLCMDDLKRIGARTVVTTEDGSLGERGLIVGPLERDLGRISRPAIYACGPHGMLKAVAAIGSASGVPTQVSMDSYMACGIGVCMGCVCKDAKGDFVRVCREGPVFDAKDLKWNQEGVRAT